MSWSDLPAELVSAVADRIAELADLTRFRAVCPSWRLASAEHAARRRVPLLLLPAEDNDTRDNRRVWSLADDSLVEKPLPAARGHSFLFASHHGWTLAVAGDLSATLVNPFTGASAGLPALPFSRCGDYHYGRYDPIPRDVVWDWSPHGILVSVGNGAFFWRPGDVSWRPVSSSSAGVSSVNYCDGAFYLFDGDSCMATVVDAENLAVAAVIEPPELETAGTLLRRSEANLIVSRDELLLLVRMQVSYGSGSRCYNIFKAFRADHGAGGWSPSWLAAGGIGDRAVFVDHLRAFCVEANGFNGVRRNWMYIASSSEEVNANYETDDYGRYAVAALELDFTGRETQNLNFRNLMSLRCRSWQWPSWSFPNLQ